jgi:hypothetical protein
VASLDAAKICRALITPKILLPAITTITTPAKSVRLDSRAWDVGPVEISHGPVDISARAPRRIATPEIP